MESFIDQKNSSKDSIKKEINPNDIELIQILLHLDYKDSNKEEFDSDDIELIQMLSHLNFICRICGNNLISKIQTRLIDLKIPNTAQYVSIFVCNACGLRHRRQFIAIHGHYKRLSNGIKFKIPKHNTNTKSNSKSNPHYI